MRVSKLSKILIKNLSALLESSGSNQADLARRTGNASSNVSNWFKGKNTPSLEKLDEIAKEYGVTVADLLRTDETPESRVRVEKVALPETVRDAIESGNAKLLAQITEKIGPVISALQAQGAEEVVVREVPKDKLQVFFNRLLRDDPGLSADFYALIDKGADHKTLLKALLKELQTAQEKGKRK